MCHKKRAQAAAEVANQKSKMIAKVARTHHASVHSIVPFLSLGCLAGQASTRSFSAVQSSNVTSQTSSDTGEASSSSFQGQTSGSSDSSQTSSSTWEGQCSSASRHPCQASSVFVAFVGRTQGCAAYSDGHHIPASAILQTKACKTGGLWDPHTQKVNPQTAASRSRLDDTAA